MAMTDLPIYEDCDSKFGIAFIAWKGPPFNPEQPKDFRRKNDGLRNPKFGRIALIF